jgi:predicted GNAT family acetyltransferase
MADVVRDHPECSRFELDLGNGATGFVSYRLAPGVITLTHSEVPAPLRGQGLGGRLVGAVLASLRGRGLRVVPACGYVARFIAAHPEFQSLTQDQAARDAQHARRDAQLDEALKETFPASDPVAITIDR